MSKIVYANFRCMGKQTEPEPAFPHACRSYGPLPVDGLVNLDGNGYALMKPVHPD